MSDKLTQTSKILNELKNHPDGVPNYKFPRMGILCYSKRIEELRKDGYSIEAERQYSKGRATGVWMYRLAGQESKLSSLFRRRKV